MPILDRSVPLPAPRGGQLATWLRVPRQQRDTSTLHILVPGGTYSHLYWDWPTHRRYSCAAWMAERGYSTLTFDRLGTGRSSHPPGRDVTIEAHAASIHHLVTLARSGELGDQEFTRIVLIGHSLGSLSSAMAVVHHGDVDAFVATGVVAFAPAAVDGDPRVAQGLMCHASGEPPFSGSDRDEDYLTTPAGSRSSIFFWEPATSQDVLDDDEQLKETMTFGEIEQLGMAAECLRSVRIPMLCQVGEHDRTVTAFNNDDPVAEVVQRAQRMARKNVDFDVVPDMGHNLTQHRHASLAFSRMSQWLEDIARNAGGPHAAVQMESG